MTPIAPIHFDQLDDATAINAALAAAFTRERARQDVRHSHHFGGRFENIYIPAERLPELRPVSDFVTAAAQRVLGMRDLKSGFWFNEMAPGHSTSLHSHEEDDELLSAVYYVSSAPDSGTLVLHDRLARIEVVPRDGLLVLFPPNLAHEVTCNRADATRLSVAFNFGPGRSADA